MIILLSHKAVLCCMPTATATLHHHARANMSKMLTQQLLLLKKYFLVSKRVPYRARFGMCLWNMPFPRKHCILWWCHFLYSLYTFWQRCHPFSFNVYAQGSSLHWLGRHTCSYSASDCIHVIFIIPPESYPRNQLLSTKTRRCEQNFSPYGTSVYINNCLYL